MTQRAVPCPNVQVLLGNDHGQVLGAEPLRLLAAAHLGDAMEQDVPLGTAELCRGVGWFASVRGWEWFLSELVLAGENSLQGHVPSAELLLGKDAARIDRGKLSVLAVKGGEWCELSCGITTRSSPELLQS